MNSQTPHLPPTSPRRLHLVRRDAWPALIAVTLLGAVVGLAIGGAALDHGPGVNPFVLLCGVAGAVAGVLAATLRWRVAERAGS